MCIFENPSRPSNKRRLEGQWGEKSPKSCHDYTCTYAKRYSSRGDKEFRSQSRLEISEINTPRYGEDPPRVFFSSRSKENLLLPSSSSSSSRKGGEIRRERERFLLSGWLFEGVSR